MNLAVRKWLEMSRLAGIDKRPPIILVNGLAEQAESWFRNQTYWSRQFNVKTPELLVYNGDAIHRHIEQGGAVTVSYLADRLAAFLDEFVQKPPYHLVGSSLGGQVVLKYAVDHPEKVDRLALLCPSGFYGEERLPVMEGVRRSRYDTLVGSVFHHKRHATERLIAAVERKMKDRRWKRGLLATLRGTVGHSVENLLDRVPHPCLTIWGANDQVIADVPGSIRAANRMPKGRQIVIPDCGHAPQIEKAGLVNRLIKSFLLNKLHDIPEAFDPNRFLQPSTVRDPLDSAPSSTSTPSAALISTSAG